MGIENLLGLQGRSEAEQKQILEALKDDKITPEELLKLGLTEKEAKALEEMFSMGAARLGDNFIRNMGEEKDARGTWQLTQSGVQKRAELPGSTTGNYAVYEKIDESGKETLKFYDKAGNRLDCKNLKEFYALEGRSAEFNDKAIPYIDKDGKIQQHLLELKKDEKTTDIRTEAAAALLTITTGGSAGMIARVAGALLVAAGITSLYSCSMEQHMEAHINIQQDMSLAEIKEQLQKLTQLTQEELQNLKIAINHQIEDGATLKAILEALGVNNQLLGSILDELMKGNQLLMDIRGSMETNNKQNDEILKVMVQILQKLNGIENSINAIKNKFPGLQAQLDAILTAIKNNQGGTTDPTAILAMLDEVIRLLKNIDKSTAATEETTRKILAAIQKLGTDQAANFAALIEAINNNYGGHGPDYTNLLNLILAKLDTIDKHNQEGYEALLNKMDQILQAIKDHHVTVDVTGTVTCNCNCGGSHEGILDDISGLIS